MSWVTVTMDQVVNKAKIDWIYLRKIVLGIVRGDQFLYIFLEVGYRYSFDCYSVSFSILRSFSLRVSLLFYTISPFHLYHPRADKIVGVDNTDPYDSAYSSLDYLMSSDQALGPIHTQIRTSGPFIPTKYIYMYVCEKCNLIKRFNLLNYNFILYKYRRCY